MKILIQVITVGLILAIAVSFIEARCFSRRHCDIKLGSRCYVHIDQRKNWNQAESCCRAWGGHLASIHSDHENYLLNHIRNKDRFTWIGLSDSARNGKYVWTDGTQFDYNKFARGQPDSLGGESCFHFFSRSRPEGELTWNDYHCGNNHWGSVKTSYICQKNMCPNLPKSRCDFVLNGKCYVFGEKNLDWHSAETCCREWGGHLASIHSDLENVAVNHMRNKNHWTWIGLSDDVKEGTFVWTDGTPHDYKNFHPSEPNNKGGPENCVDFFPSERIQWNDHACSFVAKSFVCKKDYICPANSRRQRSVMEPEVEGVGRNNSISV